MRSKRAVQALPLRSAPRFRRRHPTAARNSSGLARRKARTILTRWHRSQNDPSRWHTSQNDPHPVAHKDTSSGLVRHRDTAELVRNWPCGPQGHFAVAVGTSRGETGRPRDEISGYLAREACDRENLSFPRGSRLYLTRTISRDEEPMPSNDLAMTKSPAMGQRRSAKRRCLDPERRTCPICDPCHLDVSGPSVETLHYAELSHVLCVFSCRVVQMFQDTSLKCPDCPSAGYVNPSRSHRVSTS